MRIRRGLRFRSKLCSGAHVFVTERDTGCHGAGRVGDSFCLFPQRAISSSRLKTGVNCAFVGNTGHFENEFNVAGPVGMDCLKVDNIKPQKIFSSSRLDA